MPTNVADVLNLEVDVTDGHFRNQLIKLAPYVLAEDGDVLALLRAVNSYAAKEREIAEDRNLSPEGRLRASQAAREGLYAAVAAWRDRVVGNWDARIVTESAFLRPQDTRPKDPIERLTREIRHAEIRRQVIPLLQVEPVVIPALFAAAPDEVKEAILEAPAQLVGTGAKATIKPLLDPIVAEEYLMARAERQQPERAAALREVKSVRNALEGFANSVLTTLRNESSAPLEDPIAAAAR